MDNERGDKNANEKGNSNRDDKEDRAKEDNDLKHISENGRLLATDNRQQETLLIK